MTPPVRFGVAHDFRCPPGSDYTLQDVYAQTIEQIRRLDELGLDEVWFSEHHFVEDGYLPSWTPVAGAMAARTRRVRFSSDICLLPFSHPLRLAEDLAVLDNLSGHKTPSLVLWLVEHGVMPLYTPLSGSWLNMAESIQRVLKRRALAGQHPTSPAEIGSWFEQTARCWNAQPTPFVWNGKRRQRRRRIGARQQAQ